LTVSNQPGNGGDYHQCDDERFSILHVHFVSPPSNGLAGLGVKPAAPNYISVGRDIGPVSGARLFPAMIGPRGRLEKPAGHQKNRVNSANMKPDLATIRTERAPLETFGSLIPALVSDLSIGRAQMVAEQIRRAAQSGCPERLVILTTSGTEPNQHALAAAVAVIQPVWEAVRFSDVATVVHAGCLQQLEESSRRAVLANLSAKLDQVLSRNGIRLVQWATDPFETMDLSKETSDRTHGTRENSAACCATFGFQPIATLDYLCGPVIDRPGQPFGGDSLPAGKTTHLRFSQVCWTEPSAFSELIELVEQTYVETLDCPALASYLSTQQVLNGYRTTDAFAPTMWFIVSDDRGTPVGCVILGTHPAPQAVNTSDQAEPRIGAVEIVYMGLIPAARGKGLGTQLVQKAFDAAREVGADQVLLAVDQRNHPAKAIYQLAGLTTIIQESVWVKTLTDTTDSESKSD
jgi:GNAT superfamily N-acetyltransferase